MKLMKRVWAALLLLAASGQLYADEGMWVLKELNKQNLARMAELGFTPSYDQLYSETDPCVANAVVIFGGGCTGITVSNEGLIFTNHHCGFGAIQQLSSVEHDYLKDGFVSQSKQEELPVPGLTVRYLKETVDVSDRINSQISGIEDEFQRLSAADSIGRVICDSVGNNEFLAADVVPFYSNNKYFLVVYDVYRDVRMVFAPPSSIGKFGGDTDNWMWPRHTGDFSVFRVYANADNKPAEYNADNKPYTPRYVAEVSMQGYQDKDYAMTIGFPGSTDRYLCSWGVQQRIENSNKPRIEVRGIKQGIWKEAMLASDAVRIKYASKYAGSSNYWKNSIGMNKGLANLNVIERKRAEETAFAVSTNESRPIHTGALFEITDQGLTMVAVDGFRLAIRREPLEKIDGGAFSFVAPGSALGEVKNICSDVEDLAAVTLGKSHILFEVGDTELICRRLEGEFLDYKNAIPRKNPISVIADTKALIESIDRVSVVISEKQKSPVRCLFDHDKVLLSAKTGNGEAKDICRLSGDGGGLEIGFNNRYLMEALRYAPADTVKIELNTGVSPAIIVPTEGEENFLYMVLPVRLKSAE
jgi:hypothetical protein